MLPSYRWSYRVVRHNVADVEVSGALGGDEDAGEGDLTTCGRLAGDASRSLNGL